MNGRTPYRQISLKGTSGYAFRSALCKPFHRSLIARPPYVVKVSRLKDTWIVNYVWYNLGGLQCFCRHLIPVVGHQGIESYSFCVCIEELPHLVDVIPRRLDDLPVLPPWQVRIGLLQGVLDTAIILLDNRSMLWGKRKRMCHNNSWKKSSRKTRTRERRTVPLIGRWCPHEHHTNFQELEDRSLVPSRICRRMTAEYQDQSSSFCLIVEGGGR